MRIVWNDDAWETLENLYNYHAQKSTLAAKKLYNDILDETKRLGNFPNIAATEPLLDDYPETVRSLVVRDHYKIMYYVNEENKEVVILRLWDCRQDPAKLRIEH